MIGYLRSTIAPFTFCASFLLAGAVSPLPASEALLYRQTFDLDAPPGGSLSRELVTLTGWQLLHSAGDGAVTDQMPPAGSYYIGICSYASAPGEPAPVTPGVVRIFHADNLTFQVLLFTEQFPMDRLQQIPDRLSWYACGTTGGNNSPARAAVRINGQWYVSQPRLAKLLQDNQPGKFSESAAKVEVPLLTESWHLLRAEPGAPFEIDDSPVHLPEEPIDAFGLYIVPRQENSALYLFDTFEIFGSIQ